MIQDNEQVPHTASVVFGEAREGLREESSQAQGSNEPSSAATAMTVTAPGAEKSLEVPAARSASIGSTRVGRAKQKVYAKDEEVRIVVNQPG